MDAQSTTLWLVSLIACAALAVLLIRVSNSYEKKRRNPDFYGPCFCDPDYNKPDLSIDIQMPYIYTAVQSDEMNSALLFKDSEHDYKLQFFGLKFSEGEDWKQIVVNIKNNEKEPVKLSSYAIYGYINRKRFMIYHRASPYYIGADGLQTITINFYGLLGNLHQRYNNDCPVGDLQYYFVMEGSKFLRFPDHRYEKFAFGDKATINRLIKLYEQV